MDTVLTQMGLSRLKTFCSFFFFPWIILRDDEFVTNGELLNVTSIYLLRQWNKTRAMCIDTLKNTSLLFCNYFLNFSFLILCFPTLLSVLFSCLNNLSSFSFFSCEPDILPSYHFHVFISLYVMFLPRFRLFPFVPIVSHTSCLPLCNTLLCCGWNFHPSCRTHRSSFASWRGRRWIRCILKG